MILRLILGDQLNPNHSWFRRVDRDIHYVLMEVRQETDYVMHHAQKVIAIFAGMQAFCDALKQAGHTVTYMAIDHPENTQSITENLTKLARHIGASVIEYQEPDEWRLDQQLLTFAQSGEFEVHGVSSEHFLTARDTAAQIFKGKKRWVMEPFYRQLRRQHRVLMDGDKPIGEQWNFDAQNRKPWRGSPTAPPDRRPHHDHGIAWQRIQSAGIPTFGQPSETDFRWPLNRAEALEQLDHFIEHLLPHFGDFQDAMHVEEPFLFHSLISFALNVKMLHPREVIERAELAWREGQVPLAATEGFIRQILGWREYVRGVYWAQMPDYTTTNALENQLSLPEWFWTGQTDMTCLRQSIGQSLTHAYAHHIQRLMVIGNFGLLAGVTPQELHRWYLGIYIDAFEWVEAPNTLGMSQFADGGMLATKPYVSSAAYINRMSNYCKDCHYDKSERLGERACPFNALYWDFYMRHEQSLSHNPRIGMAYRQLNKMTESEKDAIKSQAIIWRKNLNAL